LENNADQTKLLPAVGHISCRKSLPQVVQLHKDKKKGELFFLGPIKRPNNARWGDNK